MNICPYCHLSLSRKPKRRTACPACSHNISVRKGELCTKGGGLRSGLVLETWDRAIRISSRSKSALGRVRATCEIRLDTVWRLMHNVLEMASDWHQRKMIYFQMARFLWEDKRQRAWSWPTGKKRPTLVSSTCGALGSGLSRPI